MKAEQLWAEFCSKKGIAINTPYEVWGFGDDKEGDELPEAGDYSVLLNSKYEAVCVIKNYDVYIRKFNEVPPYHAYSEGEGDRSLKYWREIHKEFFEEEAEEDSIRFIEESRVVCEKFSLEYALGKETFDDDELLFIEPSMAFCRRILQARRLFWLMAENMLRLNIWSATM